MTFTWGAVFDWDGVIIDSSRQHEKSWQALAAEIGRTLPPGFFLRSFGMKNETIIPDLFGWSHDPQEIRRLSDRKEELYREILRQDGIAALPGVIEFLNELRAAHVPCAIASSTPRENIECVIDQLGVRAHFQTIVAGQDVTRGKPDPQVFLLAAERLGLPPDRCVVFEDAHVGIQAGLAAGMRVVGLATTHPAGTLTDAHLVMCRLDELSVSSLAKWFQ